jgi:hypothetical protein
MSALAHFADSKSDISRGPRKLRTYAPPQNSNLYSINSSARASSAGGDLKLLGADQRARFDEIVRDGKGQMPAWAGMIADDIRSRAEH